jgi:CPA2 family monovalent cation:H+ antiporter-2
MVLSMLAAPFLIHHSDRLALRLAGSEWMMRSLELHRIAARSIATEGHVIILGYGRTGQHLAHLFESDAIRYVALDLDPEHVREAAAAGESVVYADASRREALIAAGITRAKALVISFVDTPTALRVLHYAHELNPAMPVIVRTRDDGDLDRLLAGGATEVVPDTFESSLMLASHALVWLGVPLKRVLRRIQDVRSHRYGVLRGFFRGQSDEAAEADDEAREVRLHSVPLEAGSNAIGKRIGELGLEAIGVTVSAVKRREARMIAPNRETLLGAGDVVVLLGEPAELAAAEIRLLQG